MKIHWTIGSIPELQLFDRKEQGRLWRAAYFKSLRKPQVIASLIAFGICGAIGGEVAEAVSSASRARSIGVLIGAILGGLYFSQIITQYCRRQLVTNLNSSEMEQ